MLREGEMDATTRKPGDLPQTNTSTGGVSEGRVCVRDDPARAASPDTSHQPLRGEVKCRVVLISIRVNSGR